MIPGARIRDIQTGKLGTVKALLNPVHHGRVFPVVTVVMDSGLEWSVPAWAFDGLYEEAREGAEIIRFEDYRRPDRIVGVPGPRAPLGGAA